MFISLLSHSAVLAAALSFISSVHADPICNSTFALQASSEDASINGTYGYIFAGFEDHWVQFGNATYTVDNATHFALSGTNLTTTDGLWMSFINGIPGDSIAYFDTLKRVISHGGQVEPGVCAIETVYGETDALLECTTSVNFEWETCSTELALTDSVDAFGDDPTCTAVELIVVCLD